jgi:hypothetical protein
MGKDFLNRDEGDEGDGNGKKKPKNCSLPLF